MNIILTIFHPEEGSQSSQLRPMFDLSTPQTDNPHPCLLNNCPPSYPFCSQERQVIFSNGKVDPAIFLLKAI